MAMSQTDLCSYLGFVIDWSVTLSIFLKFSVFHLKTGKHAVLKFVDFRLLTKTISCFSRNLQIFPIPVSWQQRYKPCDLSLAIWCSQKSGVKTQSQWQTPCCSYGGNCRLLAPYFSYRSKVALSSAVSLLGLGLFFYYDPQNSRLLRFVNYLMTFQYIPFYSLVIKGQFPCFWSQESWLLPMTYIRW